MWLGPQGEEVLLAVSIKPLLSHRREDSAEVGLLKDTLKLYGAGGWKDTEDLPIGQRTPEAIRRAIFVETGGFIWWGTKIVLESRFVNEIEIPTAFERKGIEPLYPIVPLFVDIDPGTAEGRESVRVALGERGEDLLECSGLVAKGEPAEVFCRQVAARYVRDAVRALSGDEGGARQVTVAIRSLSEPAGGDDLTFDWRPLINARTRTLTPDAGEVIFAALSNCRESLQRAFQSPNVLLDVDLPLPLGFMLGYEWRLPTRLRLSVVQRTGTSVEEISSDGEATDGPTPIRTPLPGGGPAVLAVSCRQGFGDMAVHYAEQVEARELITLHEPGLLDPVGLRGLARAAAAELQSLTNRGMQKHLLMLGPQALAVFAGAAANATGPVSIPFWDGTRYVAPLIVGT